MRERQARLAHLALAGSLLVAAGSLIEAVRGATLARVALLIGGALALCVVGVVLEALAQAARLPTPPPSARGVGDQGGPGRSPEELLRRYPRATLRWLRGRLGLSHEAFAAHLGASPETVAGWEALGRAIAPQYSGASCRSSRGSWRRRRGRPSSSRSGVARGTSRRAAHDRGGASGAVGRCPQSALCAPVPSAGARLRPAPPRLRRAHHARQVERSGTQGAAGARHLPGGKRKPAGREPGGPRGKCEGRRGGKRSGSGPLSRRSLQGSTRAAACLRPSDTNPSPSYGQGAAD